MPYLEAADGNEIHFRDWGSGTPVVLIHGWPITGDMWENQANYLVSHGARVITYDRRGFGLSGHTWDGYDYDTFAGDLHALIEELDLEDAVLVGFSMGGGEVVRYLSEYGEERVSKAVLVSAVTPFLLKTEDNPDGIDEKEFDKIGTALLEDRNSFLSEFGSKFYGRSVINHTVSDAVLQWTQAMTYTASLRSIVASAKAWSTTDFREDMKRITIPVRVIHGTSDSTVPIDQSARKAMKFLTNATLSEYEGEPHGLFMTAPDKLNAELLDFIQLDSRVGGSSHVAL